MLRCMCCGEEFEYEDAPQYRDCVGVYQGAPAYETHITCPNCGEEDYEEVYRDEEDEDDEE